VNMTSTTIVGKELLRIPPNPYASNAAPLMTSIAREPNSTVSISSLSRRETDHKEIRAANAADELAPSEMTSGSTYRPTTTTTYRPARIARAALTAFMGGPLWRTSERRYPHQEPGHVSKPPTSKLRRHFERRIMRMPNQLGVISIRNESQRQPADEIPPLSLR
jgi:hypothetical protein